MIISTFRSQRDKYPARVEMTWDSLVQGLSQAKPAPCSLATCALKDCTHKEGLSWSPAFWKPGATRGNANIEGVSALSVDIDDVSWDDLLAILGRLSPYRHIVHGSHSDRPDARRLRAIIALTRPILGSEFKRFWKGAITGLGLPGDRQTKDPARLFFLPSRAYDGCHSAFDGIGYLFYHQDGALLDVDAVLATVPEEPELQFESVAIAEFAGAPPPEQLEAAAQTLGQAWPSQGRHQAQLALAGALARAGWPAEIIAHFCARVAEIQQPGNAMFDKRLKAAQSSITKAQEGSAIAGWPTVAEHVGEEVIDEVVELLGLASERPEEDLEFVAAMEALLPAPAIPTGPLSSSDLKIKFKEAQKLFAGRKDFESLKAAEILKRVNGEQFLTDDPNDSREAALADAALVLARVVQVSAPGTTADQLVKVLIPSAGALAADVPAAVERAIETAKTLPSIFAKKPRSGFTGGGGGFGGGGGLVSDFILETQGPRVGRPVPGAQANIRLALQKLGVQFRYNEFAYQEEVSWNGAPEVLEDHHFKILRAVIEQQFDFRPPKDDFIDLCEVLARENSHHPILQYIESLPKDIEIKKRCETWLIDYAGAPDTPYVREISRIMLVAAVRRVRQPGCLFQEMLILETPEQGKNKSTALKALAVNPDWFTDDFTLHGDTKRMMESTQGKWIIEAGELKGMSQGDHNALKSYLSRLTDRARMAFGRKNKVMHRQFVIFGTTNDTQYLKDQSGNRRVWPVRIQEFNIPAFKAIVHELWAEAAVLDLMHPEEEYIRLDKSLYEAAAVEQRRRKVDDPFEIRLDGVLGDRTGCIRVEDVWKILGFTNDRLPNKSETAQIGTVMQGLGWSRERRMFNRVRGQYFQRGTGDEIDHVITVEGSPLTEFALKYLDAGSTPKQPDFPGVVTN